jgi:hypothetical protein
MSIKWFLPFLLILIAIIIIMLLITGIHTREHTIKYEIIPSTTGEVNVDVTSEDILIIERNWENGDVFKVDDNIIYTHDGLPSNIMITLVSKEGNGGIKNIGNRLNLTFTNINFKSSTKIIILPVSPYNKNVQVSKYSPPMDLKRD